MVCLVVFLEKKGWLLTFSCVVLCCVSVLSVECVVALFGFAGKIMTITRKRA